MYRSAKVYSDGSHYIAIPHTTRNMQRRRSPQETTIFVTHTEDGDIAYNRELPHAIGENGSGTEGSDNNVMTFTMNKSSSELSEQGDKATKLQVAVSKALAEQNVITAKEVFNELYEKHRSLSRNERKQAIIKDMRSCFCSDEEAALFVDNNIERKKRNMISRRVRAMRKANLHEFNYFVTITYDDKLHTEETFRKKLRNTLSHLCSRKDWRYIGVWERSPKSGRLHFHGVFSVPADRMPGEFEEIEDYSFSLHNKQITHQNSYFKDHFGRNDFRPIDNAVRKSEAMAYIMKYMEKSGTSIVYSRGLPQYFISDIDENDVVCSYGVEDKKLLLFDDFNCWNEGCLVGKVSKEVIAQMPKAN